MTMHWLFFREDLSDFSMFSRSLGYPAVILVDEFLKGSVMVNHSESIAADSSIHR